jgi:hypothetical protein
MRPVLEHLPLEPEESFVVKSFDYGYYPTPWHFHPEYELVLVTESTGKRFVGDNISHFKPGNLAFIGRDLPHLYRNDPDYYQPGSALRARSIVVHFSQSTFGEHFLEMPEARKLNALLARSARGLDITGATNQAVAGKLHELCRLHGLPRWIKLLEILDILSESEHYCYISSTHLRGQNELE